MIAVYGSLVPLNYRPLDMHEALRRFRQIPFLSLGVESRADWVGNILLFIPVSYCWLAALVVDGRRILWKLSAAVLVALGCALLSVALEFTQLWFPPRTVSQNDIAAETLGGLIGVVLWLIVGQSMTDWVRIYTSASRAKTQVDWLLEAYFVGLLIYSVMPLDLTISSGELVEKYRSGKIILVPFAGMPTGFELAYALFCDWILFVPVGMLTATWGTPADRPARGLGASVLLGAAVALAIEVAQLFVYSRYSTTGQLITGTAGVLAGALAARWWHRRVRPGGDRGAAKHPGGRRMLLWLAAAALYAAFLAIIFWAPFEVLHDSQQWKARYQGFWAVPFARLYYGSEYHALTEVLRKVLFFVPLGLLLAKAGSAPPVPAAIRRLLLSLFLLAAAGFGAGIELGQVLLVDHVPDITDAALYTSGTALGMFLTCRVLRHRSNAE